MEETDEILLDLDKGNKNFENENQKEKNSKNINILDNINIDDQKYFTSTGRLKKIHHR